MFGAPRWGSRLIASQERAGSQKSMMRIDKIRYHLRCSASLATQQGVVACRRRFAVSEGR